MPENTNILNMSVEEAEALGFKHLGLIPPQHPLVAEIMHAQYAAADEYVLTQLSNIKALFLPQPTAEIRKECEALGFIFNDKKTRDKKFLVHTTLPEGWYVQMPDESDPRNCFWFRIMDNHGRARYEIYYNANPHPEQHKAVMTKLTPYQLKIIHEYPIKNKSGKYLTGECYRGVILDSNGNLVEVLGSVYCSSRDTDAYRQFENRAQEAFKKYSTIFTEPTDSVRPLFALTPHFSFSNKNRLLQLIATGAVPRTDAEMREKCEKLGFVFHDGESLGDIENIFECAAIYDSMLVRATLPEGWSIALSKNNTGINSNLWFDVNDDQKRTRLHFYFVNTKSSPGLLHATMRML